MNVYYVFPESVTVKYIDKPVRNFFQLISLLLMLRAACCKHCSYGDFLWNMTYSVLPRTRRFGWHKNNVRNNFFGAQLTPYNLPFGWRKNNLKNNFFAKRLTRATRTCPARNNFSISLDNGLHRTVQCTTPTRPIRSYTVRCDELKLTLGNLFLCYLIGIFSWRSWK